MRHPLLRSDEVEGEDPLAAFPPNISPPATDNRFEHVPDILVNSFYDPHLQQGGAFEELISFHGGLGGPQTRPFILHPAGLPMPSTPLVGAAAVHNLLAGWRRSLQSQPPTPTVAEEQSESVRR